MVAEDDKKLAAVTLVKQRFMMKLSNKAKSLTQWDLVLTGIKMVLKTTPSIWINSFKRVNLHPGYRVEFKEWTDKISGFLEAGSTLKNISSQPSPLEKYALLPKFWWGMTPTGRKQIVNIVAKYGDNSFGLECLDELHESMNIPYTDMDNLRVCVYISNEHLETLDYKVSEPDWDALKRMKLW